jgi:hypothetical protein
LRPYKEFDVITILEDVPDAAARCGGWGCCSPTAAGIREIHSGLSVRWRSVVVGHGRSCLPREEQEEAMVPGEPGVVAKRERAWAKSETRAG